MLNRDLHLRVTAMKRFELDRLARALASVPWDSVLAQLSISNLSALQRSLLPTLLLTQSSKRGGLPQMDPVAVISDMLKAAETTRSALVSATVGLLMMAARTISARTMAETRARQSDDGVGQAGTLSPEIRHRARIETVRILENLLQMRWRDDCELAGKATVDVLVAAVANGTEIDFRRARGLANWDTQSIQTVIQVLRLMNVLVEFWTRFAKAKNRKPTEAEFAEATLAQSEAMTLHGLKGAADAYRLLDDAIK
jgi:hypothetical protein